MTRIARWRTSRSGRKLSGLARRARSALLAWWDRIEPVWPAALVLIALIAVLILLRQASKNFGVIGQGIYIEAWGTVLDVLLVGVILALFALAQDRRQRILRYLEEIDDFKKWDSEEGRLRILGGVRRLTKLGRTDIDFSGIVLRNVSFPNEDISSLKGATFSLGLRLDKMSRNATELENVDFAHVDCTGVIFSRATFNAAILGLVGKNLGFISAKLIGASFDGATLSWTDYKENRADWFQDEGEDDDGRPILNQVHYPAFSGADLRGCSFRYAKLDHADFREAENILEADFTGAQGLETCFFDDKVRERILAQRERDSEPAEPEAHPTRR